MDLSPDEDHFQGRLLHQAALWDNLELLQELIASGEAVDARDHCNRSALHAAALAERSRCLAALCAAGAEIDAKSDAATGGKAKNELIASSEAVDARDHCNRSALHAAALAERSRCLAALCAAGAEINAKSDAATGGKVGS
ncbi:hypothetical protein PYW07_013414 [Mythimna separata]|uniref:ANK_REP_REGION domain-containing protein n=1 Tax=Mythimna separata TaxID=271217 RepID=A0AAD7Y6Q7_MYTSE|nr:hypothetical protein PYW07_013414 [Mythimna separata]